VSGCASIALVMETIQIVALPICFSNTAVTSMVALRMVAVAELLPDVVCWLAQIVYVRG
jgi:hypothetical protein